MALGRRRLNCVRASAKCTPNSREGCPHEEALQSVAVGVEAGCPWPASPPPPRRLRPRPRAAGGPLAALRAGRQRHTGHPEHLPGHQPRAHLLPGRRRGPAARRRHPRLPPAGHRRHAPRRQRLHPQVHVHPLLRSGGRLRRLPVRRRHQRQHRHLRRLPADPNHRPPQPAERPQRRPAGWRPPRRHPRRRRRERLVQRLGRQQPDAPRCHRPDAGLPHLPRRQRHLRRHRRLQRLDQCIHPGSRQRQE